MVLVPLVVEMGIAWVVAEMRDGEASMGEPDWMLERPKGGAVEVSWKQTDDGVYVEVAVMRDGDRYVVVSTAEHRVAGPSTTRSGPFMTAEEARTEAARLRAYWDGRLQCETPGEAGRGREAEVDPLLDTPEDRARGAAVQDLEDLICELSEEAFFAAWMTGIEFELWECLVSGRRVVGQIELDDERLARLRELSFRVNGWLVFPSSEHPPTLIAHAHWTPFYGRWKDGESVDGLLSELVAMILSAPRP